MGSKVYVSFNFYTDDNKSKIVYAESDEVKLDYDIWLSGTEVDWIQDKQDKIGNLLDWSVNNKSNLGPKRAVLI